jgi:hypothetical protein
MTSRRLEDDERLLAQLGEAVRRAGPVPHSVREAGRAAFARRTVDAGLVLAGLKYDSLLDAALHLRGDEQSGPRIMTFQADVLSVEIELAHDKVVGQLIPPTMGEVAMMTVDGIVGRATANAMGCFVLPPPLPGPVRFRCQTEASTLITEWVRL